MPEYKYQGRNSHGEPVRGHLQADSEQAAIQELTRRGYFITDLKLNRDVSLKDLSLARLGPQGIRPRDLALFARQLGVLYAAGIPILSALMAIRQQQGLARPLVEAIRRLEERLASGASLAIAMRADPAFPAIFTNLVSAGEAGGHLDDALSQAAAYFQREYQLGRKVRSALTYPKFVAIIALGITWFLLATVLPSFASIFASFDMELPAITRFMLAGSDWLVDWGWIVFTAIAIFLLAWRYWRTTPRGRATLDRLALRLPFFGQMLSLNAIARFCRTLGALTHSGVNVVTSLQLAEQAVDNSVFTQAMRQAAAAIGQGSRLASALEQTGLFPPLVTHMVRVGESSGSLDIMLRQVADFYDADLNSMAEQLTRLIEPIVILVVALIAGLIALAIALPMMQMVNIVQF